MVTHIDRDDLKDDSRSDKTLTGNNWKAGLVFALVATQVVIGYTLGKDAALRDNAAAEIRQAD